MIFGFCFLDLEGWGGNLDNGGFFEILLLVILEMIFFDGGDWKLGCICIGGLFGKLVDLYLFWKNK